jgi:hypothetical protein
MRIINQDKDKFFTLTAKGFYKSKVCSKKKFYKGRLYGWNVYGSRLGFKTLLGTYDTEFEANQIVEEIYRLLKMDEISYVMPEPALEMSEWSGVEVYE